MHMMLGFGIGNIAECACEKYGDDFFYAFIDNDEHKQGQSFHGKMVLKPEMISELQGEYMVAILIAMYEDVLTQLVMMGIDTENIYIFDKNCGILRKMEEVFGKLIFSQSGEEFFLRARFGNKTDGFYIDVGAYHPFVFSNTAWAYKMGWSGINIEPNLERFKLLESFRNRDINLNCGISCREGKMNYYMYEDDSYNTFSNNRTRNTRIPMGIENIEMRKMSDILEEYGIKHVDFIDIDVEGTELDILQSIDFDKVDISYILLEQIPLDKGLYSMEDIIHTREYDFLRERGYIAASKYDWTVIYEKGDHE